jgi:hypothetical protein
MYEVSEVNLLGIELAPVPRNNTAAVALYGRQALEVGSGGSRTVRQRGLVAGMVRFLVATESG